MRSHPPTHWPHDRGPSRDTPQQRCQTGAGRGGCCCPSQRRQAFDQKGAPPDLQALIDKVEAHAYRVTDDDLRRLQAKYSDDELFEIIVSAALGASERRLLAGLEALDEA